MQIEQVTRIDQIKENDLLLISDGNEITHAKAQKVKVSEHDGTEVIFDKRKNKYFNVGMYLNGASWAKDVCIVRTSSLKEKQPINDDKETWSVDNEIFRYDSLHKLIDWNVGSFNPGDTVYVGIAKPPLLSEFCDADDVIDLMMDRGSDIGGEFADDFMSDVTDEAKSELTELLKTWMEKHVTVNFFTVENVREYILTEEDLLEKESGDKPTCTCSVLHPDYCEVHAA